MGAPSELAERLTALEEVLTVGAELVPAYAVTQARAVAAHAAGRLRHGTDFTVVAFAGATGSGKSSLFNAVVGDAIAPTGLQRPTTAEPRAAVFGPGHAGPLLDWLEIKQRHSVAAGGDLDGLVLIDLPDHDSVELSHRTQVDHFVEHVDLLIWVLDPQKYADEALHHRYLRRLAGHGDVMAFALHQADTVPPAGHRTWSDDAARLLAADGIAAPRVLMTSVVSGQGLEELLELLADQIGQRSGALARIDADLKQVAAALESLRAPPADREHRGARRLLATGLGEAVGASAAGDVVAAAYRHEVALATGWPFTRWGRRLRRHPLRRLRPAGPGGTSAPPEAAVDRPRLQRALKEYADGLTASAPPAWSRRLRAAAASRRDELATELQKQVAGITAGAVAAPRWWRGAAWLQRVLALAAVAGAVWLLVLVVFDWLRISADRVTPEIGGWPVPTLLLLGGAAGGLVTAAAARGIGAIGANRRRQRAHRRIDSAVAVIAGGLVAEPVAAELEAWQNMAAAVAVVAGEAGYAVLERPRRAAS